MVAGSVAPFVVHRKIGPDGTGDGCPHFWKIEPANGPVSLGRCRYCGMKRGFRNSVDVRLGKAGDVSSGEPLYALDLEG